MRPSTCLACIDRGNCLADDGQKEMTDMAAVERRFKVPAARRSSAEGPRTAAGRVLSLRKIIA